VAGLWIRGGLFSYVSPEARVPANHPLRKIRELVRDVLNGFNRDLGKLYASVPAHVASTCVHDLAVCEMPTGPENDRRRRCTNSRSATASCFYIAVMSA
jgi:hypothetical protein